jgi:hypothetical protein
MSPVESQTGGIAYLSFFRKNGFNGAKLYLEVHPIFIMKMGGK